MFFQSEIWFGKVELAVEQVIPTDEEGNYKVMDIKRRTVEENGERHPSIPH